MRGPSYVSRVLLVGALLAAAPGRGEAEGVPSPLAEMRAAAEAQADVDPEPAPLPRREVLPGGKLATGRTAAGERERASSAAAKDGARAALHAAVHSAVQAEIAREVQGIGRGPDVPNAKGGGKNKDAPGASTAEPGRSEAAHANEAAAQAQQARLNRTVGQMRGLGHDKPDKGDKKMVGKPLILPAAPSGRTGR